MYNILQTKMGRMANKMWFCLCLCLDFGSTLHILKNTPSQFITDFLLANGLNSLFIIRDVEYLDIDKEKTPIMGNSDNFTMTQFPNQLSKLNIQIAVVDYPLR